jgi:hypothetical protein
MGLCLSCFSPCKTWRLIADSDDVVLTQECPVVSETELFIPESPEEPAIEEPGTTERDQPEAAPELSALAPSATEVIVSSKKILLKPYLGLIESHKATKDPIWFGLTLKVRSAPNDSCQYLNGNALRCISDFSGNRLWDYFLETANAMGLEKGQNWCKIIDEYIWQAW